MSSPYSETGAQQIAQQGEAAGKIAYASVQFPADATQDEVKATANEIEKLAPNVDGVQIEYGGQGFANFAAPSSELLGLGFAIVILTLAFGSVLATGLPIGTALGGIAAGSISLTLLSNVFTMPDFATTIGVMMGLGVGIDYALFIVSRYRENLHHGHDVEDSISLALDTSGRAVAFAGLTVVISLLGMLVMGVQFVSGLGIGAAVVVLMTMIASLTLLPALIGFAGRRTEVARWRGAIAAGLVAIALIGLGLKISPFLIGIPLAVIVLIASFVWAPLRAEVPKRAAQAAPAAARLPLEPQRAAPPVARRDRRRGAAHRAGHPVVRAALRLLRPGQRPQGHDHPPGLRPARRGLRPRLQRPARARRRAARRHHSGAAAGRHHRCAAGARRRLRQPGRAERPGRHRGPLDRDPGDVAAGRGDHRSGQRAARRRAAAATQGTGIDVVVTGSVATQVDFSSYLSGRMPWFFAAVLGLSFLLLLAVFRSVLVPIKAVVMNLLSIGAAYGIVVAIFQWGWLHNIVPIEGAPIEPFLPMMLFAIVFGLSMDYEVFLLSRIKEEWDRTGDSHSSVADGLAATARIITVAAAIMVVVFGSFLLEPTRVIRLFGLGLAVAVLLDATVVRMLLVPATMELLGDKNWWLPKWLDRILPHIDVEGPTEAIDAEAAALVEDEHQSVS